MNFYKRNAFGGAKRGWDPFSSCCVVLPTVGEFNNLVDCLFEAFDHEDCLVVFRLHLGNPDGLPFDATTSVVSPIDPFRGNAAQVASKLLSKPNPN